VAFEAFLGRQPVPYRRLPMKQIRAYSRATRREDRIAKGLGFRRSDWHRKALSAYTSLRTDRGPQKGWLHRIGGADDPSCTCGYPTEDGSHITFTCPRF